MQQRRKQMQRRHLHDSSIDSDILKELGISPDDLDEATLAQLFEGTPQMKSVRHFVSSNYMIKTQPKVCYRVAWRDTITLLFIVRTRATKSLNTFVKESCVERGAVRKTTRSKNVNSFVKMVCTKSLIPCVSRILK